MKYFAEVRLLLILLLLGSPLLTRAGQVMYAFAGVSILNRKEAFLWYLERFSDMCGTYPWAFGPVHHSLWQIAQDADTRDAYHLYLDTVRDYSCLTRWDNRWYAWECLDELDWQAASALNTLDAYNNYLAAYPNGQHVLEAKQVVFDEPDWQKALAEGRYQSYSDYFVGTPEWKAHGRSQRAPRGGSLATGGGGRHRLGI